MTISRSDQGLCGAAVRVERGTTLIEMVVLAFVVVAMMLPAVSAVVGLADARARAATIAHDSAVRIARHGAHEPVDDVAVSVEHRSGTVVVTVRVPVTLVSVAGLTVSTEVAERVSMPISPYRSDP